METIVTPLELHLSNGWWTQPSSYPTDSFTVTSPGMSRCIIGSTVPVSTTSKAKWSPRLAGMSDVLGLQLKAKGLARLPSIGVMINRDTSSESLSPVQKHRIDLYKQRHDNPKTASLHQPQLGRNRLPVDVAVSHVSKHQTRKILPASSRCFTTDPKAKRTCKPKLCGTNDCTKRAKAGGFCIAHGGGLRCSKAGCAKHAVSLGLCISHGGGKRCTVEGCLNASRKNGVCWSHGGKRLCKLEGCNKGPKSGGYCWSHGGKMKKETLRRV